MNLKYLYLLSINFLPVFAPTAFSQTLKDKIQGKWCFRQSTSPTGIELPKGVNVYDLLVSNNSVTVNTYSNKMNPFYFRVFDCFIDETDSITLSEKEKVFERLKVHRISPDTLILSNKLGYHIFSKVIGEIRNEYFITVFLKNDTIRFNKAKSKPPRFKKSSIIKYYDDRLSFIKSDSARLINIKWTIGPDGSVFDIVVNTKLIRYIDTIKAIVYESAKLWSPAKIGDKSDYGFAFATILVRGFPLSKFKISDIEKEIKNYNTKGNNFFKVGSIESALDCYQIVSALFEVLNTDILQKRIKFDSGTLDAYINASINASIIHKQHGNYMEACKILNKIKHASETALEKLINDCGDIPFTTRLRKMTVHNLD